MISRTGETKEIIEVAELAKLNNAPVIGLAPEISRLSRLVTIRLQTGRIDSLDRLSFSSQTAYQVMLDILAAGISVQKNSATRMLNKDCFKDYYKVI